MDADHLTWEKLQDPSGRVKEHSKSTTSAIHKHCTNHHTPCPQSPTLPSLTKIPIRLLERPRKPYIFKGWTHISTEILVKCSSPLLWPSNWCKTQTLSCGPPLMAAWTVDGIAPPSQTPCLDLTQFNTIRNFRPDPHAQIPRHSTWACRAKIFKINSSSLDPNFLAPWHELSSVIPSSPSPQ